VGGRRWCPGDERSNINKKRNEQKKSGRENRREKREWRREKMKDLIADEYLREGFAHDAPLVPSPEENALKTITRSGFEHH